MPEAHPMAIETLAKKVMTQIRKSNKSHAKNVRDLAKLLRRIADVYDDIADGLLIV